MLANVQSYCDSALWKAWIVATSCELETKCCSEDENSKLGKTVLIYCGRQAVLERNLQNVFVCLCTVKIMLFKAFVVLPRRRTVKYLTQISLQKVFSLTIRPRQGSDFDNLLSGCSFCFIW